MKTLITFLIILIVGGCVSARYNRLTGELNYTRIGNQNVAGVMIEEPNGVSVLIENQNSETKLIDNLITLLQEMK